MTESLRDVAERFERYAGKAKNNDVRDQHLDLAKQIRSLRIKEALRKEKRDAP